MSYIDLIKGTLCPGENQPKMINSKKNPYMPFFECIIPASLPFPDLHFPAFCPFL